MKVVVSALAAAFIATLGASSAAQAAFIDFSGVALCPVSCTGITFTGGNLGLSTALDLDGSTWIVSLVKPGDASGLAAGNPFTVAPTTFTYGAVSGPGLDITLKTPIDKTWDGALGPFTEHLTTLDAVDRGLNSIAFVLSGTVTGGVFHDAAATMQFSLTQAGGPGNVVSASLTNSVSNVPEPSTWVMMALGFVGLGYAAVRRGAKERSAIAF